MHRPHPGFHWPPVGTLAGAPPGNQYEKLQSCRATVVRVGTIGVQVALQVVVIGSCSRNVVLYLQPNQDDRRFRFLEVAALWGSSYFGILTKPRNLAFGFPPSRD